MSFYFEWNQRKSDSRLTKRRKGYIISYMGNVTEIIGENISALRRANNLTQQQLANKLNYSNKAVSRWEKGECLPSIEILSAICDFFGVEFDYLIHKHDRPAKIKKGVDPNKIAITLLACVTVFTVATIVFVYVKVIHDANYWQSFVWGVPVSCFIIFELGRRWGWNKIVRITAASVMLWSIIAGVFLTVMDIVNIWPLFLIGIPLQVIMILLFFVSRTEKK